MGRLVHTSLGSSYLIAHVLHGPPPRTQLYHRSCSNKHTHLSKPVFYHMVSRMVIRMVSRMVIRMVIARGVGGDPLRLPYGKNHMVKICKISSKPPNHHLLNLHLRAHPSCEPTHLCVPAARTDAALRRFARCRSPGTRALLRTDPDP
jgi:hypothetical protein